MLHCSDGGLYLFDGATDTLLSDDIWVAWQDMMGHVAPVDIQRIPVVYHPEPEDEIGVAPLRHLGAGRVGARPLADEGGRRLSAWTTRRRDRRLHPVDGREAVARDQGRLWSWKIDKGQLAEESIPNAGDDGGPMTSYYEGPALLPAARRWARFIEIFGEYRPVAGDFTVEVLVDDTSVCALSIDIAGSGVSAYGASIYGASSFSGKQRRYFTSLLPLEAEGNACTVRATYVGVGLFKLFTYALGVRPNPTCEDSTDGLLPFRLRDVPRSRGRADHLRAAHSTAAGRDLRDRGGPARHRDAAPALGRAGRAPQRRRVAAADHREPERLRAGRAVERLPAAPDTDAARSITGLLAQAGGRLICLTAASNFNITLVNQSAASAATNRFLGPGAADCVLTPGSSAWCWYDVVNSWWRIISTAQPAAAAVAGPTYVGAKVYNASGTVALTAATYQTLSFPTAEFNLAPVMWRQARRRG